MEQIIGSGRIDVEGVTRRFESKLRELTVIAQDGQPYVCVEALNEWMRARDMGIGSVTNAKLLAFAACGTLGWENTEVAFRQFESLWDLHKASESSVVVLSILLDIGLGHLIVPFTADGILDDALPIRLPKLEAQLGTSSPWPADKVALAKQVYERRWKFCSASRRAKLTDGSLIASLLSPERASQVKSEVARRFGWSHNNLVLQSPAGDKLIRGDFLGFGSVGFVETVHWDDARFEPFVRKRVQLRRHPQAERDRDRRLIQEEAANLRSLNHHHIVSLIGTYETSTAKDQTYSLLMDPIGDSHLGDFLDSFSDRSHNLGESDQRIVCIWTWFGCLSSALCYMHNCGLQHQYIKPSNIVHKGDRILFTDFSSARLFNVGHTTSTNDPARSSPMYASPEVEAQHTGEKHGRGSDAFSLACVFCDMLTVAEGRNVGDFRKFLVPNGGRLCYSDQVSKIGVWFSGSTFFKQVVSNMLAQDRTDRP